MHSRLALELRASPNGRAEQKFMDKRLSFGMNAHLLMMFLCLRCWQYRHQRAGKFTLTNYALRRLGSRFRLPAGPDHLTASTNGDWVFMR